MDSILISGSPTWTDRARVHQVIDSVPDGWIVVTSNGRGLDRAVQGCVNARLHLALDVVEKQVDEAVSSLLDRMVAKARYSVVFRGDGLGVMLAMRCRAAHRRTTVIDGAVLDPRVAAVEVAKVRDAAAHASWKAEEGDERERFFEHSATYHSDGVDYHAHDVLNPEREAERMVWLGNDRPGKLDPHAQPHLIGADTIHRTLAVDGTTIRVAGKPKVMWERQRPWIDAFAEEGELPNLEDFTMDELAIVDSACHLGYSRKIGWRIEHGVPLGRELFEEMAKVVAAAGGPQDWTLAESAMKGLAA